MKIKTPLCVRVRVLHHGNGETTYIAFLPGGSLQISTDKIPFHLRAIGAEFFLEIPRFTPEAEDDIDAIRKMCASYKVVDSPSETPN